MPDRRPRWGIRGWDGVVNVDENARVACAVGAREGNEWARIAASTTGDFDLSAGDVELGTSSRRGGVQSNMLYPQDIFTRWNGSRDGDADGGLARAWPVDLSRRECGTSLRNLEPDLATAIPSVDCRRCLGHVEEERTRMRDSVGDSEGGSRASRHSESSRSLASTVQVATNVSGRNIRNGSIRVVVVVLANVLVITTSVQVKEAVVTEDVGSEREGDRKSGEQLHRGRADAFVRSS